MFWFSPSTTWILGFKRPNPSSHSPFGVHISWKLGMPRKSSNSYHLKQMMKPFLKTLNSNHGARNAYHAINIKDICWSIILKIFQERDLSFVQQLQFLEQLSFKIITPKKEIMPLRSNRQEILDNKVGSEQPFSKTSHLPDDACWAWWFPILNWRLPFSSLEIS